MTPISPEELDRHRRTSAVAQRIALHEATIALDVMMKRIEAENPGRGKGPVSTKGQILSAVIKACADTVWALHMDVSVPDVPIDPYVPFRVNDRHTLEASVQRHSPGAYPHLEPTLPSSPDQGGAGHG